ncbi:lipase member H-B [Neodiprion lecontei]|uniref:phospholipase A1 n=1 Tax=Neodiprion lecontei TaxID=441921 RepID=A0A6J0BN36_NEOLC|nr:lipase member H-B [Neodiprion lecontei]
MMARFAYFLFFGMALVNVASPTYTPCDSCTDRANSTQLENIELYIFTGDAENTSVLIGAATDLVVKIDASKPTVLYFHGWTESSKSTSVQTIVAAYLERADHNVLVLDYSEIAGEAWNYAYLSTEGVGYTVAIALDEMVAAGLDATTLNLVGHSLGAQVMGYIGKNVNFTIPKITGLDPAGPGFTETDSHLQASDADFVEIIHTEASYLGIDYSAGDVDFWPNGGSSQPGCSTTSELVQITCSHARSWAYFAESLSDEDAFLAIACDSYTEFEAGSCSSNTEEIMGYATPNTAAGNYMLQTNSDSPYGRGEEGTTYVE